MEYTKHFKQLNTNKDLFCNKSELIILFKVIKMYLTNKFINLIIKEIGINGTLIFPTYNWDFCRGKTFDIKNSRSRNW